VFGSEKGRKEGRKEGFNTDKKGQEGIRGIGLSFLPSETLNQASP
jgi:hypothetical protein